MRNKGKRKKEIHVGIDIGTRLIKTLEVSQEATINRLTKFQLTEISSPYSEESIASALKTAFEKLGTSTKEVNISLSAPSAIVRFVDMPKMKPDDLKTSLKFEAEKYIPFNINEVIIDASILENASDEKTQMRVLLAAAKKDYVDSRLAMLKGLGLTVSLIDIDSFACYNAFCNSSQSPDGSKSTALLNIGYAQTNVIIARGSNPFFTRDIQIGGRDMAKAIAQNLEIAEEKADKLIYDPKDQILRVEEAVKPVLGSLADELRLSFGYYENQNGKSVDEIFISGGIARMPGILNLLEGDLGAKPALWDPFAKFEINQELDMKRLESVRSQFAVCAGLAIRR